MKSIHCSFQIFVSPCVRRNFLQGPSNSLGKQNFKPRTQSKTLGLIKKSERIHVTCQQLGEAVNSPRRSWQTVKQGIQTTFWEILDMPYSHCVVCFPAWFLQGLCRAWPCKTQERLVGFYGQQYKRAYLQHVHWWLHSKRHNLFPGRKINTSKSSSHVNTMCASCVVTIAAASHHADMAVKQQWTK